MAPRTGLDAVEREKSCPWWGSNPDRAIRIPTELSRHVTGIMFSRSSNSRYFIYRRKLLLILIRIYLLALYEPLNGWAVLRICNIAVSVTELFAVEWDKLEMFNGGNSRGLFQQNFLHSSAWIKEHCGKICRHYRSPNSDLNRCRLNLRREIIVRLKYKTQFTGRIISEPFLRTRWALSWSRNTPPFMQL